MTQLEEKLYKEYLSSFEKAERERRWSVFDDIPWERVNKDASEELALCAETFCSCMSCISFGVWESMVLCCGFRRSFRREPR